MDELASVGLIVALARVWAAIRARHPEVPAVVLLAAPNPHSNQNVLGHFAALRWSPKGQPAQPAQHEVIVVAEHLNRRPEDIVATLLHEAAHAMNFARGIKDCSASQYHNQRFKAAAEELGLVVTQVPHYGFALTQMPPETAALYAAETEGLSSVLIHRRGTAASVPIPPKGPDGEGDEGEKGKDNSIGRMIKAVCECGYIIRASRKVLAATTVTCSCCGRPFEVA